MPVNELGQEQYVDIFGDRGAAPAGDHTDTRFGMSGGFDVDLFGESSTETTTIASTGDTTTLAPVDDQSSTTSTTTLQGAPDDTTIIGETEEEKAKPGRKAKYDFSDAKGYFEDRFKNGKFVAMKETLDDGSEKDFIPSTPEEFDEVIEAQVEYRIQEKQKELEQGWYKSKSPAWQAVAKYAEMTDNPGDILPFIQGVQAIGSVAQLNEEEIEGAEQVIRVRLQQRGDPDDVINEQIDSLKASDRLISTAKKYKPLILQEEKANLQRMAAQKKQEETEYNEMVDAIRETAIKAIETPILGNIKLKQQEKFAIYELIAEPSPELQGYPIYAKIDEMYEKGDLETLKLLALLTVNKEALFAYISSGASNKTAESLQKKIRVAADNKASGGSDPDVNQDRPVIQRKQYGQVRFGRA
jgi:hypothetical protein